MRLLPEERRKLDLIDGTLRTEAPVLASKFDMFTRLSGDDGTPPAEKQLRADSARRYGAFARRRVRRCYYVVVGLALAALALALLVELP